MILKHKKMHEVYSLDFKLLKAFIYFGLPSIGDTDMHERPDIER